MFENLLFPKIFRSFRLAVQPTKLAVALGAVAVICLVGRLMDINATVVTSGAGLNELQVYISNPDRLQDFIKNNSETGERVGVFSTLWHFSSERFHQALYSMFSFNLPDMAANIGDCFRAVGWAIRYHYFYSLVFFLVKLAVISIAGGAICRIAALQFARDEKPGLTESLRFALGRFLNLFTTPLLPIGMIVFIGVFVFLLGLVSNIPRVGELILAVFMPLALLAGILIAVVLIGAVAGFNLMFPAVGYDGSDCFDAVSRAFSYVYSRPWRMAFYSAAAVVYGAICYVFVRFLAFLLLSSVYLLLDLGTFGSGAAKFVRLWQKPTFVQLVPLNPQVPANWTEWISSYLIYLFVLVVVGLVVSFVISFYFSANTVIYALLRKLVDNTALDDVYTVSEETSQEPTETQPQESEKKEPEPKEPEPKEPEQGESKQQEQEQEQEQQNSEGKSDTASESEEAPESDKKKKKN